MAACTRIDMRGFRGEFCRLGRRPTPHTMSDEATKARLHLLWTELSRLVERVENDDSDTEEEEDVDVSEEIVNCCDRILSVLPGDADALRAKAVTLIADGDFGAAELATRAAQGTGVVAIERGYALWRLSRSGEALRELERSPNSESLETLSLVAQVYYQMGDYVKAAEMYERLFAGIDSGAIGGGDGDSDDDEELDDDDRMELCTNLAAAYVNADLPRRALAVVERRFPQSHLYELLFNRLCSDCLRRVC